MTSDQRIIIESELRDYFLEVIEKKKENQSIMDALVNAYVAGTKKALSNKPKKVGKKK